MIRRISYARFTRIRTERGRKRFRHSLDLMSLQSFITGSLFINIERYKVVYTLFSSSVIGSLVYSIEICRRKDNIKLFLIVWFYRLKQIKEFHRRHPGEISVPMSVEFEELKKIRENPADDLAMIQFRYFFRIHSVFNQFRFKVICFVIPQDPVQNSIT